MNWIIFTLFLSVCGNLVQWFAYADVCRSLEERGQWDDYKFDQQFRKLVRKENRNGM